MGVMTRCDQPCHLGLDLNPMLKLSGDKGNVYHAMKTVDPGFNGFAEAYFSSIFYGARKGWKKHTQMTLNIIVPVGEIRFVVVSEDQVSNFFDVTLSLANYQRLTVPPGLWVAFEGIGSGCNMLLNMANVIHDPKESETLRLDEIEFDWHD